MEFDHSFIIEKDKCVTFPDGFSITNVGGGHKKLLDRSDLPFGTFLLRLNNQKERIILLAPSKKEDGNKKFWNGFLITNLEQEFYGRYSKLLVHKPATKIFELGKPFELKLYETGIAAHGLKIVLLTHAKTWDGLAGCEGKTFYITLNVSLNDTSQDIYIIEGVEPIASQGHLFTLLEINASKVQLVIDKCPNP